MLNYQVRDLMTNKIVATFPGRDWDAEAEKYDVRCFQIELVKKPDLTPLATLKVVTPKGKLMLLPIWGGGELADIYVSKAGNLVWTGAADPKTKVWLGAMKDGLDLLGG